MLMGVYGNTGFFLVAQLDLYSSTPSCVGYNLNFKAASTSGSFYSSSSSREVFRQNYCVPTISLQYFSLRSNCVLKAGVSGSASFVGTILATSSFSASAQVGGGYFDGTLENLSGNPDRYYFIVLVHINKHIP